MDLLSIYVQRIYRQRTGAELDAPTLGGIVASIRAQHAADIDKDGRLRILNRAIVRSVAPVLLDEPPRFYRPAASEKARLAPLDRAGELPRAQAHRS